MTEQVAMALEPQTIANERLPLAQSTSCDDRGRLPTLDGLRGLASLAVMWFHFTKQVTPTIGEGVVHVQREPRFTVPSRTVTVASKSPASSLASVDLAHAPAAAT